MSTARQSGPFDLAVIGGGVNGCGIARDAAGRGASVVLFEQDDLAGGTSSRSTKLIHGGLRYLEYYEFRLVQDALRERDVLWRLRRTSSRRRASCCRTTAACGRAGCCGSVSSFTTTSADAGNCRAQALRPYKDVAGEALKPAYRHALEYSDCRSTMRGWSCSTRDARRARRRHPPAHACHKRVTPG